MLYITDNFLLEHQKADKKFKLSEFVNTKRYTVSDTPLTYRQTRTLDQDNLLPKDPKRAKGWRKYSFKELVYILIVYELKQFGLQHEQLKGLWNSFFGRSGKSVGDIVIGCVFGEVEILMAVDKDGKVSFYDPIHFILLRKEGSSLVVRVNDLVNKLLKQIGKEAIPIKYSTQKAYLDMVDTEATEKEKVLLDVLRNKDYSTIRVKKSNGQISVIYAGKNSVNAGDITPKELKSIVSEKDFQDINIIKRDGKIVNLTVEETIKP